ncbi:LysR family transcriptional regulator [Paraburkholderia sp. LEh10]|uniref:LysR substrate-binding domain-containing protein n=1 Tax=Paraburkholderia sp. LEh10 TaxID=2821353 RepID=UPI001AEB0943|nr:LysR substrate-binding domain-containing protein [Paraburkholderia sp. LEh10]MBP0589416.1 LysR family transcriptional regulator [Paraburkholderia sp. LEh10]
MLDLKDVYFFVQVVDHGGFTSAGQILRLPKSTLSHRIQELETSLGVRLINRTSRQFSMTEVGAEFYQHAQALLQGAQVAEEAMKQRRAEPSGVIRITTTTEIAQFVLRNVLPSFLQMYPKVSVLEIATDRLVDIVGEGFDLAIRGHTSRLQDSNLVQRLICSAPWYLFAGPRYLEDHPPVEQPEHLNAHSIIAMVRKGSPQWQLQGKDGQLSTVSVEPRFQSNNMVSLKEAAVSNLGIVALPGYICCEELQSGALRQILPDWIAADARISALIPYRTGLLPAVRSLVDYLAIEIPKITTFCSG